MKTINRTVILKITAITGLIGAGIISIASLITSWFYTGRIDEPYSFLNHFVSELGEVGVSDVPYIFNGGLIIGASFLLVYLMGLAWLMGNWQGAIFAVMGLIMAVSGLLVGVYPMNNIEPHITVALTFFNVGQFTMLYFSIYVLFSKKPWFSKWLAIPGFITTGFFVVFLNMPGEVVEDTTIDFETAMHNMLVNRPDVLPLAIFEWLIIAGLMVWVLSTAAYLRYYAQSEQEIQDS